MPSLRDNVVDFFQLPWIYLQFKYFEKNEEKFNRRLFYNDSAFQKIDRYFSQIYRRTSPYQISKIFLKEKKAENIHQYGETPLRVYERIATKWQLRKGEKVLELGCGRARGGIFLQHFFKCHYTGVDWVPEFIQRARVIQRTFYLERVSLLCLDMLQLDFSKTFDWIYLHGATFEDPFIYQLIKRLKNLSPKTKIITVSFPLSDYDASFKIVDSIEEEFAFGKTKIFLNSYS